MLRFILIWAFLFLLIFLIRVIPVTALRGPGAFAAMAGLTLRSLAPWAAIAILLQLSWWVLPPQLNGDQNAALARALIVSLLALAGLLFDLIYTFRGLRRQHSLASYSSAAIALGPYILFLIVFVYFLS